MGEVDQQETLSVLLLEDNPADADLIRDSLSQMQGRTFAVTHVSRLEEGIERSRSERPDVALIDPTLADTSADSTIGRLREFPAGTAVILLTDGPSEQLEKEALEQGAEEFLDKDLVDVQVLERCLDHALQRHTIRRQLQLTRRAVGAAREGVVISDARLEDDPLISTAEIPMDNFDGYAATPDVGHGVAIDYGWVAPESLSADLVEKFVSTAFENREGMSEYHPILGYWADQEFWTKGWDMEFHEGAARVYDEAGLL